MGKLWDWISGPADDLIGAVGGVIDNLHTSDEEKAQARLALLKLEHEFQSKLLEADETFAKEQSKVLQTEIASSHWLAANWRPIVMLAFASIVVYTYAIGPMFGLPTVVPMPDRFWTLLTVGLGGYVMGRSAEKIIPTTKWAKEE